MAQQKPKEWITHRRPGNNNPLAIPVEYGDSAKARRERLAFDRYRKPIKGMVV